MAERHDQNIKGRLLAVVVCTCGAEVNVVEDQASGDPCAVHPLPTCALFERCSLAEYVAAVGRGEA